MFSTERILVSQVRLFIPVFVLYFSRYPLYTRGVKFVVQTKLRRLYPSSKEKWGNCVASPIFQENQVYYLYIQRDYIDRYWLVKCTI